MTFGAVFGRLMKVRNLDFKGLAYATSLSFSTVNVTMRDNFVPSPDTMMLMAAVLCLRADDVEAMAGRAGEEPPADSIRAGWVRQLLVLGELIWALTPLRGEQIDAVAAFAQGLQPKHGPVDQSHADPTESA